MKLGWYSTSPAPFLCLTPIFLIGANEMNLEQHKTADLLVCPTILNDTPEEYVDGAADSLGWYPLMGRRTAYGKIEVYHKLPWLLAAQRCNWDGEFDVIVDDLTDEQILLRFRYSSIDSPTSRWLWLREQEVQRGIDLQLDRHFFSKQHSNLREALDLIQYALDLGGFPKEQLGRFSIREMASYETVDACEHYASRITDEQTAEKRNKA